MTQCAERSRLIEAYKKSIDEHIIAAGNLRYADTPGLRDTALLELEDRQIRSDAARDALWEHITRHACVSVRNAASSRLRAGYAENVTFCSETRALLHTSLHSSTR
jgi:hypothetical protein